MVGPAGTVAGSAWPIASAADGLQIRVYRVAAPDDRVAGGAATYAAVITVGMLQAGTKENVIPDDAIIKLDVRTFDAGVRKHVLAIERIVNAEAAVSGATRMRSISIPSM